MNQEAEATALGMKYEDETAPGMKHEEEATIGMKHEEETTLVTRRPGRQRRPPGPQLGDGMLFGRGQTVGIAVFFLAVIVFFVLGAAILSRVDIAAGQRQAAAA